MKTTMQVEKDKKKIQIKNSDVPLKWQPDIKAIKVLFPERKYRKTKLKTSFNYAYQEECFNVGNSELLPCRIFLVCHDYVQKIWVSLPLMG